VEWGREKKTRGEGVKERNWNTKAVANHVHLCKKNLKKRGKVATMGLRGIVEDRTGSNGREIKGKSSPLFVKNKSYYAIRCNISWGG